MATETWNNEEEEKNVSVVSRTAALQSVAEVGLGSVLHSFHVPFGGHFLSLNQGLLLTFATKKVGSRKRAFRTTNQIAFIASVLKSLSPAGKKLTPMLAISAQGFLYSLGLLFFGSSLLGALVGMTLLALWGVFQPLAVAYVVFGKTFFQAVTSTLGTDISLFLLAFGVLLKLVLSWVVVFSVWRRGDLLQARYEKAVFQAKTAVFSALPATEMTKPKFAAVLKDIFSFWFLCPLFVTVLFLKFGQHRSVHEIWLYALRPLAVAWLLFWALRSLPKQWWSELAQRFPQTSRALELALGQIRSRT